MWCMAMKRAVFVSKTPNFSNKISHLCTFAWGVLFFGCSQAINPTSPNLKPTTIGVQPKPTPGLALQSLNLEWASTPEQRQIGLMNRANLPENSGMMFVFEQNDTYCFWMKSTLIPLSVGFIDSSGVLVQIEDMRPQTTQTHCAKQPIKYALEVNQGWFDKNRITPPISVLKAQ